MPTYCECRCHQPSVMPYVVDTRDYIEAVLACPRCVNAHVPALTCPEWPIVPKPNPMLLPWVDSYPPTESEGRE